jgi:hypothetical protein
MRDRESKKHREWETEKMRNSNEINITVRNIENEKHKEYET